MKLIQVSMINIFADYHINKKDSNMMLYLSLLMLIILFLSV